MKLVDECRLETDPTFRFEYVAEFIGFTAEDATSILAAAPYLGPLIPQLVERTYEKLLSYDATARHFVPRQHGYEGPLPADVGQLTSKDPQIQFRKEHLTRYFMQLLGRNHDARIVPYLDMVGKIHTSKAGNPDIEVPLVQMNCLMGLMSDLLTETLAQQPWDDDTRLRTIRAFQKLMWIQNDFITRHYQANGKR